MRYRDNLPDIVLTSVRRRDRDEYEREKRTTYPRCDSCGDKITEGRKIYIDSVFSYCMHCAHQIFNEDLFDEDCVGYADDYIEEDY